MNYLKITIYEKVEYGQHHNIHIINGSAETFTSTNSMNDFKSKIKNLKPEGCACRPC